ncbi:MAG: hypothetical protein JXX28_14120 [Deltaproteobacteria bacterium]|nr:hypothetical protein [Deltaproteobacteria bacterium]
MEDSDLTYELVYDAVRAALRDAEGGDARLLRRMEGGRVIFEDGLGQTVKAVPIEAVFKKITAVREKLRVLEQKLNNAGCLTDTERAEFQRLITKSYGSLTTFNFLFAVEAERFSGTGS